jgi:formyl-CoA transferase
LIDVETPRWGKVTMQNAFPKLSDTPSAVRSPAPDRIGQHNEEVYRGVLGMDDAALNALSEAGAI